MAIDLIGSGDKVVALVEIGSKKEIKEVVKEIVAHNKNVKSVLERVPGTKGEFRLRKSKLVWGDKNTEVLHKEYGYVLRLDPRVVYFSPRESTIRQHISSQVKPGESVLVMFAGICPFAICISKIQPKVKEIVAVEINSAAFDYMKENIRMNKASHLVTPIEGDVRKVCKKFSAEFDRIIMPMIKSKDYLPLAIGCAKKSATIYLYMISKQKNLFEDCKKFIDSVFKKLKKRYEVKGMRKISLYAPGKWKVLMEIKLK